MGVGRSFSNGEVLVDLEDYPPAIDNATIDQLINSFADYCDNGQQQQQQQSLTKGGKALFEANALSVEGIESSSQQIREMQPGLQLESIEAQLCSTVVPETSQTTNVVNTQSLPSVSQDHDYIGLEYIICDPNNNELKFTEQELIKSIGMKLSNPVSPLSPSSDDIGYESMSSPELTAGIGSNPISLEDFTSLKDDLLTPYGSPLPNSLPLDILADDELEMAATATTQSPMDILMDPCFHDLFPEIFWVIESKKCWFGIRLQHLKTPSCIVEPPYLLLPAHTAPYLSRLLSLFPKIKFGFSYSFSFNHYRYWFPFFVLVNPAHSAGALINFYFVSFVKIKYFWKWTGVVELGVKSRVPQIESSWQE